MKVLFVIESYGTGMGGRERRMLELIKGLNRQDLEIEVNLILLGVRIVYKEMDMMKVNIYKVDSNDNFKLILDFFQLLRMIRPEIVQTWTIKTSLYFSFLKSFFNYKLIVNYISDSFGYKSRFLRYQGSFINMFADRIIGNSIAGLESYNIPKNKRIVIYNGYDLKRLKIIESREVKIKRLNIKTPHIVLMVANISRFKDYNTFIEVARFILNERKDISFISIGAGEFLQKYKSMLKIDELDYIKFLGHRDDVDEIIEICDIGLLCTFSEGISNAILEYMMHKKPVIATGTGGTSEIVKDGISGYILPASSPILVANKIIELIDNPINSMNMGFKGYKLALNKFSLFENTNRYYQIYTELAK